MEKDLEALADKINELVQVLTRLRGENLQLQQELAAKADENKRLNDKITTAAARLEAVLSKIPEKEAS